jgi:hypothetical protein
MQRRSAFDRDFRDLHGFAPRSAALIEHCDVRNRRLRTGIDFPVLRLAFGLAGLLWAIIIGGALLAFTVVAGIYVYAFFTT